MAPNECPGLPKDKVDPKPEEPLNALAAAGFENSPKGPKGDGFGIAPAAECVFELDVGTASRAESGSIAIDEAESLEEGESVAGDEDAKPNTGIFASPNMVKPPSGATGTPTAGLAEEVVCEVSNVATFPPNTNGVEGGTGNATGGVAVDAEGLTVKAGAEEVPTITSAV
ncbi:hypothetical protein CALCODRAFT_484183 [Calocera cornea HHB12733]|uniref:Uncharacterized protein n=1 Tax=Calocera cornea HHB12733 TaxID=1353952 RepID=A0A165F4D1_9BASI|nr:hypothetical protein CALCODRAFT_484183 [Calocera cornea HHB12733]